MLAIHQNPLKVRHDDSFVVPKDLLSRIGGKPLAYFVFHFFHHFGKQHLKLRNVT